MLSKKNADNSEKSQQNANDPSEHNESSQKAVVAQVPMKKILYIDIDDEITQVYDRMKNLKIRDIYIVVPARAVLFQSVVNLKILKRKAIDLDKNISIITNDRIGIHLANQAGITVYDRIEEPKEKTKVDKILHSELRMSPLQAFSNPRSQENPTRLPKKKISIFELVRRAKSDDSTIVTKLQRRWEKRKQGSPLILFPANKRAMTGLILLSAVLLLAISYITLPGATIYLTPKMNVLEMSVNITFADAVKNSIELSSHPPHSLASYPVSMTIKKTLVYNASGQIFQGTNASGKITIINESNHDWALKPRTRFQTAEGLVFRTSTFLSVPPATPEGFGTVEASVTADEIDANGKAIGERGNIQPTSFFLPGLSETSRNQLYGKSNQLFAGGTTLVIHKIIKEDIDAAKEKAKKEIIDSSAQELKNYVLSMNKQNGTSLNLLADDVIGNVAIKQSEPRVFIANDLVEKQLETFEVSSELDVSGVAFNQNELQNILKAELKLRKSPEKRLVTIDENSVYYRVFETNEDTQKIKVTATIKGEEEYEINPDAVNGARLIQKITEHILGKNVEEAKTFIQNLPEINKVEIKTWPVWAPSIPKVANNIEVKVVKEGESIE